MSDALLALPFILITLGCVICGIALYRLRKAADDKQLDALRKFIQTFPGRCPVCSFHQYGYSHGFEEQPVPPPHRCIERLRELSDGRVSR